MSDIAENLLAQYYGLCKKSETEKFISIHECMSNVEDDVEELIGEQSTVDTANDNDTSRETEEQENVVENEERNSETDIPTRSSRALEWEALEDNEKTSSEFDIIFEENAASNLYENTNASSGKETQDLVLHNAKTITLDPENNEENDLYLSLNEDALPDSASDVSSIAGEKKTKKSPNICISPSTPPPNKSQIYNENFVDLTSAGLTFFPIEVIEKYSTIQMLYLENNNLSELPKELFVSLPHLQWLDVRNNQLTNLPTSIRSHPSLESILLQGNKFEKLPLELCLAPKLKILNIAHNPIITPPKDVIALGCSGILNYLRTEWNKLHPDDPAISVEQKVEPKLSTILCYQSPHEKRRKLSKISQQASKSTNDIGSFKGISVRKRSRAYKPSNRYINWQINTFLEDPIKDTCIDDATSSLCTSCARNLADIRYKNENNTKENKSDDYQDKKCDQHAFLKMITSCHDVSKTCIRREIAEVDAKILHLIGPSPRSCYVRRNVTGLITYKHYSGKECRIKTISNETKHITLAKSRNPEVFSEEKKKCRNTEHVELIFDIVTKDMQRMQLRPMQLKDSRCILSCLENYLDIKTDKISL